MLWSVTHHSSLPVTVLPLLVMDYFWIYIYMTLSTDSTVTHLAHERLFTVHCSV